MLYTNINKGIIFISIENFISEKTIKELNEEVDFMLYDQGMDYYAFNFNNLNYFSRSFLENFKNLLTEIFLKCGRVAIYGLDKITKNIFGTRKYDMYYVDKEEDIFKLLSL